MINLRYHIVSLAAVFLALAAGIALGAGFLDEATTSSDNVEESRTQLSQALAGYDAAYASLTAPGLTAESLDGQSIIVFTTPSARSSEAADLIANVEAAGGVVSGEVELTSRLLNPSNRQFAEGVSTQAGGAEVAIGEGYDRIGAVLGRAYLATETTETDELARTIRAAFAEGALIETVTEPEVNSTAAIILTGPERTSSDNAGVVLSQFVQALDETGQGTVVAGPVSSGEDGGAVDVLRNSDAASAVSTVDVTDSATGRVGVILALAQELEGNTGAWGTSRAASGPIPR